MMPMIFRIHCFNNSKSAGLELSIRCAIFLSASPSPSPSSSSSLRGLAAYMEIKVQIL